MKYVYSALLLHSAEKPVNEENIKKIIESIGIEVDEAKIKALVSSLEGVDIDEAMEKAAVSVAASAPASEEKAAEEEEDEEDDEKKAEEAAEGLSALFG